MFWKNTISINPPSSLRYKTKSNSIIFWCSGLDFDNKFDKNNDATAALLREFFIGLSKERKVFFYAYRLPDETWIIDHNVILSRAERLLDPYNTFFYLSEARIQTNQFGSACNTELFFFRNDVEWLDFLATAYIENPTQLLKSGIL